MNPNETPSDPNIVEQNIERLLGSAYRPERPDAGFAQRVQAAMQAAAQPKHTLAVQSLSVRGRLILAWSAVAAALVLGLALLAPRFLPADPAYDLDEHGVWIKGQYFTRADRSGANQNSPSDKDSAKDAGSPAPASRVTARPLPPSEAAKPVAVGVEIRTAADERRRVPLPDGSTIYVNENTSVEVTGERRLTVTAGEVFVEVAPHATSRFVVLTPDREVVALGTKFSVRKDSGGTGVLVAQGEVQISGSASPLVAGQELKADSRIDQAPRVSHALAWTRDLMIAAHPALVPSSPHRGGSLVIRDLQGQEGRLSLRKYAIDVHIDDGFARTTIDQTYFNHENRRLEGTFYFPLPPDASLSRLAMYVEGVLMEGGMLEHDRARTIYESIVAKQRDPALLEWIDGSTFKMRVFPLEARQEKRIILSYSQRLPTVYGKSQYRFPVGHTLEAVRDWSFQARVQNWPAANAAWSSDSHTLKPSLESRDLLLQAQEKDVRLDKDVVLNLSYPGLAEASIPAFATTSHEGHCYLLVRHRPELPMQPVKQRRDWVFLSETAGDRNPLLARTQIEIIRGLLANTERGDTFALLTASTRPSLFAKEPLPVTPENVKQAIEFLEKANLIGALDLDKALQAARPFLEAAKNPHLVHVGSGTPVLGERRTDRLATRLPQGTRYVGIGVGRRWSRAFMKAAADRTAGHFTQINPDEPINWRVFDLVATLNTPRLLDVKVVEDREQAIFLPFSNSAVHGEELVAIGRFDGKLDLPGSLTISGTVDGKPYLKTLPIKHVREKAEYLPRSWAKLEIERLLAEDAVAHRADIVELSKAMYVMTPFTSLLVLESEKMYAEFNVDRGRKDHWALYPCPERIPVVHEPLKPEFVRRPDASRAKPSIPELLKTIMVRIPPRAVTWRNRRDEHAGRTHMTAYDLLVSAYALPFPNAGVEVRDPSETNFIDFDINGRLPVIVNGADPRPMGLGGLGGGLGGFGGGMRGLGGGGLGGLGGGLGGFGGGLGGLGGGLGGLGGGLGGFRGGFGGGGFGGLGGGLGGFGGFRGGFGGLGGGGLGGFQGGFSGGAFQGGFHGSMPAVRPQPPKPPASHPFPSRPLGVEWLTDEARRNGWSWKPQLLKDSRPAGDYLLHRALTREAPWLRPGAIITNDAATAEDIAWRMLLHNGPHSLSYQPISLSSAWRVFGDLLSYAPGLNTTAADIQAVVEAEAEPDPHAAPGRIDMGAFWLIERARAAGWQRATVPARGHEPAFEVVFDGRGRYRYEREINEGLRESAICDGQTLLLLYPDIGLGAKRTVSRFHRAEFLALVPWALPPAADLIHGADIKHIGERTVAIQPRNGLHVHLHFANDGRLAETRQVDPSNGEIRQREGYDANGIVRQFAGDGGLIRTQEFKVQPASGPELGHHHPDLVLLDMPWREYRTSAGNALDAPWTTWESAPSSAWERLLLLGRPQELLQHIRTKHFDQGDYRLGLFTLLAAVGAYDAPWLQMVAKHNDQPLARYLWNWSNRGEAIAVPGQASDWHDPKLLDSKFLQRLQAVVALERILRREGSRHKPGELVGAQRRALALVSELQSPTMALALLTSVAEFELDEATRRQLADAFGKFVDSPEWEYPARYERARQLWKAGDHERARTEFEQLYARTAATGILPPIDADFRQCLKDAWADFIHMRAAEFLRANRITAVVGLAWQLRDLGDAALAERIVSLAEREAPLTERFKLRLATVEMHSKTEDLKRATLLLQELLDDPAHARRSVLWRLAGFLATQQQKLARVVFFTEGLLEAEYTGEVTHLSATFDEDHLRLLYAYGDMLDAAQQIDGPIPAGLRERIIRTAERWRRLSPEFACDCCLLAGLLLSRLGDQDLAWDYLLTSLAHNPEGLEEWAEGMSVSGLSPELQLRLSAVLLELHPTQVNRVFSHAVLLYSQGHRAEARTHFRRVIEGEWPDADQPGWYKQQAWSYLQMPD